MRELLEVSLREKEQLLLQFHSLKKEEEKAVSLSIKHKQLLLQAESECFSLKKQVSLLSNKAEQLSLENAKLIGHNNTKQKIQQHLKVKKENNSLREKLEQLSNKTFKQETLIKKLNSELAIAKQKLNLPFTPLSLPPSSLHHQDSFLEDNTSPSFHKQTLELELKNSQLSLLSSSFSSLSSSILSLLHSSPPLSSPLNFQLKEKQQANQTQKQFSEEEKKQSEEEKKPSEEEKKPSEEEKKPSEEEKKPSEEEKKPSEVEINEICSNCEEQVRKSVLIIKQFSESFDNTKRQLSQLQFELDLLRNQHSLHSQKLQVANILHSSTSSPSSPFCSFFVSRKTEESSICCFAFFDLEEEMVAKEEGVEGEEEKCCLRERNLDDGGRREVGKGE